MKQKTSFAPFARTALKSVLAGAAITTFAIPGVAAAQSSNAKETSKKQCATGAWSQSVQGRPTVLQAGATQGAYLWHDKDGWHLRVTHPGTEKVEFTGTIQSSRKIAGVARAIESNDEVAVVRIEDRIDFRFANYGRIDGIDFRVGCSNKFVLNFSVNGVPFSTSQLFIGSSGYQTSSTPLVVERT